MENGQSLENTMKELADLYTKDDIFKVFRMREDIECKIFSGDLIYENLTQEEIDADLTDYERFKESELVKKIDEDKKMYLRSWKTFQAIDIKEPDYDYENIKSWSYYEEGSNCVTICGRITVRKTFIQTLAGLLECDLMKFISFKEMSLVDKLSLTRFTMKCRIQMPTGFSDRETLMLAIGMFIPGTKDLFIPFKSINEGYYQIAKHQTEYELFNIAYGFYHLKMINENECQLTNCYNLDPNIAYIPQFILNQFMKSTIFNIMKDIKTQIETTIDDEKYTKRITETNKEFYDMIKSHI